MDQLLDWGYGQLVGFFGNFFSEMGAMGVELFEMSWVQSIVLFFSYLAWALYGVGLVVPVFETGIEYQNGRASVKDTAMNAIKGFLAVAVQKHVARVLVKLGNSRRDRLAGEHIPLVIAAVDLALKFTITIPFPNAHLHIKDALLHGFTTREDQQMIRPAQLCQQC